MPKRHGHVPGYLLHKPSGQARVIIDGKHVYLGEYGSPESHEKYARLIAEFSHSAEAAMVNVQRLTAMRPCEVVLMRPCDLDTSGEVWIYEPHDHKNRWRGRRKQIPLGPECQSIIAPFLSRDSDAFIFSPKEVQEWRMERRVAHYRANRKSKVYPSEIKAREKARAARRKKARKRPPRDRYDTDSYRRAIEYGVVKASKAGIVILHWFPYQLRHTHGTEIRKLYGIEAASVMLGHARPNVTEVYAEKNMEAAMRIAKETG